MKQKGIFGMRIPRVRRVVGVIALGFSLFALGGCQLVEDGEMGVSKQFGKISDAGLVPGIHLSLPVVREIEVWDIKTQRKTLRLNIPDQDGLVVRIETTVLFRPEAVVKLRKEIGVNYIQRVLEPTITDIFREVIGRTRVEDLIKNPGKLTAEASKTLKSKMKPRGIAVEELLVTDLGLPQKFKEAIERKLESEQRALQKEFELQQAKKDAEIEVARAEGAAKAQEIVRSTLSAEYLQYLWISTLNQNPNVIYVATEANMPMFRTSNSASGPVATR